MGKVNIALFLILGFALLTANTGAYQTCDGGYSPYPVKCIGGGGSTYTGSGGQQSSSVSNYVASLSLSEIIWIIVGVLAIIYFGKKIFFGRRRFRPQKYHPSDWNN